MAELGHNAVRGRGRFISFEGTEGGGKSTQIELLAQRLRSEGFLVKAIREPGGTSIGEEIRHTLKQSPHNHAMTAEAELLLMNASRAQLVREVIRPALAAGEIVVCDRFADSTIAYQAYGRGLNAEQVQDVIQFAVGDTWPDLTLLLSVPLEVSEQRRIARISTSQPVRDRFEEMDREFFQRVEKGFQSIAENSPSRVKVIDATQPIEIVQQSIWSHCIRMLTLQ